MSEEKENPELTSEELEYVKEQSQISFAAGQFSEQRSSELADQFTGLEVQVAALLLAFSGIFLEKFSDLLKLIPSNYNSTILWLKGVYALSVFCIIVSLTLGLIHIKRREKFWEEWLKIRMARAKKWREILEDRCGIKEAKAFMEGTWLEKTNLAHAPQWTWILQTTFLAIAIGLFFIIFIALLFVGI